MDSEVESKIDDIKKRKYDEVESDDSLDDDMIDSNKWKTN